MNLWRLFSSRSEAAFGNKPLGRWSRPQPVPRLLVRAPQQEVMLKADVPKFRLSRREFIKVSSLGGIWLVTRNLTAFATEPDGQGDSSSGWSGSPGKARYRIEGRAKALGQKIFARDFRARDMAGWPADEACAMVLRTAIVGRTLTRIDLSLLPADLQPFKIVTAADLNRDGFVFPTSDRQASVPTPSLFADVGSAPQFLGQPIAILLFKNYWTYVRAHGLLQFNRSILKYAEASSPPPYVPEKDMQPRPSGATAIPLAPSFRGSAGMSASFTFLASA